VWHVGFVLQLALAAAVQMCICVTAPFYHPLAHPPPDPFPQSAPRVVHAAELVRHVGAVHVVVAVVHQLEPLVQKIHVLLFLCTPNFAR
jgi:hypothetical protein